MGEGAIMTQLSEDAQHLLKIFTDTWNQRLNARNHNLRFQARKAGQKWAMELAMQLMRDAHAPTLDELLASRTVIHAWANQEGVYKTYSGLSISAMEPAFKQLTAAGYVAHEDGHATCPGCQAKDCAFVIYELPGRLDGPGFNICFQCLQVYEQGTEWFEDMPELNEAVTAHPEGLPTIERMDPVQRDTSSVGQTAPKPSLSAAASTL